MLATSGIENKEVVDAFPSLYVFGYFSLLTNFVCN